MSVRRLPASGVATLGCALALTAGVGAVGAPEGAVAGRATHADRGRDAPERAGSRRTRAAGLEDVRRFAPGIGLDPRYAGPRNLTGRRLPGYCRPWALLGRSVARDLARVQRRLRRRGYGLLIYDAYRPARASRALVRWARRNGRGGLIGSYLARRSDHNRGGAVDLTLIRYRDRRRLRMGSRYDDLSRRANTRNARGRVLRNRLRLVAAMERFGFSNYEREWWHFDHPAGGPRYLDLALGCRDE